MKNKCKHCGKVITPLEAQKVKDSHMRLIKRMRKSHEDVTGRKLPKLSKEGEERIWRRFLKNFKKTKVSVTGKVRNG